MTLDELRNLDLRDVDLGNIGEWPLLGRALVILVLLVLIFAAGYFIVIRGQLEDLSASRQQETVLKQRFERKQHLAVGLKAYQVQLAEMRKSFGELLAKLPSKNEIDDLLRDISQTAQQDGLDQKLFQPQGEEDKGFYAAKPIKMEYVGGFQQIAKFVSDVSALSRIVTLRNFVLKPVKPGDGSRLDFSVTGVTYRYLSDEISGPQSREGKK